MVRGRLKFVNAGGVPAGQRVTVRLEDTSRVGASSVNVAEASFLIPEDFDADSNTLPFEIDVPDPVSGLTIRAHMPRHDGSDVRQGDMITTQSIPASREHDIIVPLTRV